MITVSLLWLSAISVSIIVWFLIAMAVSLFFMWGDDRAFIVGPLVATLALAIFWLTYSGVIQFVE